MIHAGTRDFRIQYPLKLHESFLLGSTRDHLPALRPNRFDQWLEDKDKPKQQKIIM